MILSQPKSAYQAKNDGDWQPLLDEVAALSTIPDIMDFRRGILGQKGRDLPNGWRELVLEACADKEAEVRAEAAMRGMDRLVGQIDRGER